MGSGHSRARLGFTLIEILVVVVIIALLLSILLSSLSRVQISARSFVCKNKLKTVAFDFIQFADDYSHPWRGDSDQDDNPGFRINDFQEKLYVIAEFWKRGAVPQNSVGITLYKPSDQTMICPAGPQELYRRPLLPCNQGAVGPVENVSMAINARLAWAFRDLNGRQVRWDIDLSKRILNYPSVPLAFDVNGTEAKKRSVWPYYAAPPAGESGPMGSGLYWFPAMRHGGSLNAAFVGGHVLSSSRPEMEAGWKWKFSPPAP